MSERLNRNTELNISSFRNYWLRKLAEVQESGDRFSPLERIRIQKKIQSMIRHLNAMEENSSLLPTKSASVK